jgi:preprotein translocase SecE subunit
MGSRNTWVALFYLSSIALFTIVLDKAIGTGLALSNTRNTAILGDNFTLSTAIGLAVSVGVGAYCWVTPKIRGFCDESVDELGKVSWPDWVETRTNTLVTVIFSFICAGILGVMDAVFGWLTNQLTAMM